MVPICWHGHSKKTERTGILRGIFQVFDGNILMLVHPVSGDNIFYKVKDDKSLILLDSFGSEPKKRILRAILKEERIKALHYWYTTLVHFSIWKIWYLES